MENMSENTAESTPVEVPVAAEPTAEVAPVVEKKKRGRKPKVVVPEPAPVVAAASKPRKKKVVAKQSKADKMLAAMLESAEMDRIKTIDEMAKLMEHSGVKQARLDAIKWKVSSLRGESPQQAQGQAYPNYPLPPMYPQPPAYPHPSAPSYMPPGMRTPALPQVPMAAGGAVDAGIAQNEDEDMFLKGDSVVAGGKWA